MLPSLGVFSLAGSFRCLFLLLFLGALYVAWVSLTRVYFLLDFFFLEYQHIRRFKSHLRRRITQTAIWRIVPSIAWVLFLNRKT
jgi:hypothetical protein